MRTTSAATALTALSTTMSGGASAAPSTGVAMKESAIVPYCPPITMPDTNSTSVQSGPRYQNRQSIRATELLLEMIKSQANRKRPEYQIDLCDKESMFERVTEKPLISITGLERITVAHAMGVAAAMIDEDPSWAYDVADDISSLRETSARLYAFKPETIKQVKKVLNEDRQSNSASRYESWGSKEIVAGAATVAAYNNWPR